jgi:hypothetical protein
MIKSRRMRWAGHVARMERRGMHIGFWWQARRKETTRNTRHRLVDNIKVDIIWDGVVTNWIDLPYDLLVPSGRFL